jgi:hypothetical protein
LLAHLNFWSSATKSKTFVVFSCRKFRHLVAKWLFVPLNDFFLSDENATLQLDPDLKFEPEVIEWHNQGFGIFISFKNFQEKPEGQVFVPTQASHTLPKILTHPASRSMHSLDLII